MSHPHDHLQGHDPAAEEALALGAVSEEPEVPETPEPGPDETVKPTK